MKLSKLTDFKFIIIRMNPINIYPSFDKKLITLFFLLVEWHMYRQNSKPMYNIYSINVYVNSETYRALIYVYQCTKYVLIFKNIVLKIAKNYMNKKYLSIHLLI